jgi:hypothetical protein
MRPELSGGYSIAQSVSTAIDAYLYRKEVHGGADVEQMHLALDQLLSLIMIFRPCHQRGPASL